MIDEEFLEFVEKVGRATLSPEAEEKLPPGVFSELASCTRRLKSTLQGLDRELGLVYPAVRVAASCFAVADKNGQLRGFVPARTRTANHDHLLYWVIELSAHTPLICTPDLLQGILAHEFLHYAWYTVKLYEATVKGVPLSSALSVQEYVLSGDEAYKRIDTSTQVCPEAWLTTRLQSLAATVDDLHGLEAQSLFARTKVEWYDAGLPTEPGVIRYRYEGQAYLDSAILERANQLGLTVFPPDRPA